MRFVALPSLRGSVEKQNEPYVFLGTNYKGLQKSGTEGFNGLQRSFVAWSSCMWVGLMRPCGSLNWERDGTFLNPNRVPPSSLPNSWATSTSNKAKPKRRFGTTTRCGRR